MYEGDALPGYQPLGEFGLGFVLEQVIPAAPGVFPTFQSGQPPLGWIQAPGSPWQPTPSWSHPVYAARQHSDNSSSADSLGIRPEMTPFQSTTSSVITGRPGREFLQPGGPHPIGRSGSVPLSTRNDPVSVGGTFLLYYRPRPQSFFLSLRREN